MLFYYLIFLEKHFLKKMFFGGVLWGSLVMGGHFLWLYQLLLEKSNATLILSCFIYIFILIYASLLSGICFLITAICSKLNRFFIVICTILFFYLIQNYSLVFLGRVEGYPFLNPILPLILQIKSFNPLKEKKIRNLKFIYLKPLINTNLKEVSPSVLGQDIYKELLKLDLKRESKRYDNIIILSPETAYPFSLNHHLPNVELWSYLMCKNIHMLIGSQLQADDLYQAVYYINDNQIKNFYVKKHCVAFTEKVPSLCKSFLWATDLFLKNRIEFKKGGGALGVTKIKISNACVIFPKICSEFFFCNKNFEIDKFDIICVFVNDSWFNKFFKNLLIADVYLTSLRTNNKLIYISHEGLIFM